MIDFSTLTCSVWKFRLSIPSETKLKAELGHNIRCFRYLLNCFNIQFLQKAMELSEILYNKAEYIETVIKLFFFECNI